MFAELGAPLRNVQWSWGAEREDGAVFLRVWQDETVAKDGKRYIRLVNHRAYESDPANLGYQERLEHLSAIAAGAEAFAILLRAVDPKARPRSIAGYNSREVFPLGEVIQIDGDDWAEFGARIPTRQMVRRNG